MGTGDRGIDVERDGFFPHTHQACLVPCACCYPQSLPLFGQLGSEHGGDHDQLLRMSVPCKDLVQSSEFHTDCVSSITGA